MKVMTQSPLIFPVSENNMGKGHCGAAPGCYEIDKKGAVGLKSSSYTFKNYDFCEYGKWNLGNFMIWQC